MIRGIELMVVGKSQSFEIVYESGKYMKRGGKEVEALLDMTCYACGGA